MRFTGRSGPPPSRGKSPGGRGRRRETSRLCTRAGGNPVIKARRWTGWTPAFAGEEKTFLERFYSRAGGNLATRVRRGPDWTPAFAGEEKTCLQRLCSRAGGNPVIKARRGPGWTPAFAGEETRGAGEEKRNLTPLFPRRREPSTRCALLADLDPRLRGGREDISRKVLFPRRREPSGQGAAGQAGPPPSRGKRRGAGKEGAGR